MTLELFHGQSPQKYGTRLVSNSPGSAVILATDSATGPVEHLLIMILALKYKDMFPLALKHDKTKNFKNNHCE